MGEFVAPRFDIRSEPNMWRSEILTSSTEKEISEAAHTRNQSRIKFWEDLLDVARTKSIEPWHRLKPRRGNHLTVSALPGVNVTWNIMVRAHEAYAKLWIDVGDAASNIAAFHSLQDEVDVSDLGFSLDWQSTERARACTVSSEPISGCGWSSNPQVRTPLFNDLLERERVFRTALEPHLAVVERHIP